MSAVSKAEAQELWDDEQWLLERSTFYFGNTLLDLDFDEDVHGDIFDQLDSDDWDEGLIMLPRGCFKSHMVGAYFARRICINRNFRGLIIGATHKKVAETVLLCRQFLEMPKVIERFGRFRNPEHWNSESFVVLGRTRPMREPTLYAMGVESFKAGGHHDVVVGDDLEDQDTVATPELMEKTRTVESLSYPMADEPNAKKLTVGTFWDDGDVYSDKIRKFGLETDVEGPDGRILKERPRAALRLVPLPMADGSIEHKRVFMFCKPATNPDGTALFPARLSLVKLAALRMSMSPSTYSAQYELDPISAELAEFKPKDFRYANALPAGEYDHYVAMDFARSFRKGSDHTGFCHVAIDSKFRWWVIEAWRAKMTAAEIVAKIVWVHRAHPLAQMPIELDGYAEGLQPQIEETLLLEHLAPRILWIKSGSRQRKAARISAMSGLYRVGAVTHLPGTHQLDEELLRHPKGRHRDVADAAANVLEVAQAAAPAQEGEERDPRGDDPDAPWYHDDDSDPYADVAAEDVPWKAA